MTLALRVLLIAGGVVFVAALAVLATGAGAHTGTPPNVTAPYEVDQQGHPPAWWYAASAHLVIAVIASLVGVGLAEVLCMMEDLRCA